MEREKIEKILQRKASTKFNYYQQTVLFLEPTYGCLCQNFLPITSLFYCQACMGIKCRYCVTESIKCHYCPACLQNVASAEAIMNNNKCKKCFICPECGSNLKMVEKEVGKDNFLAYLTCTFCHWNSSSLILEPAITFIEEFHKKEKGNYEQKLKEFEDIVQELKREELQKLRQKKRKRKSFGPTIFTTTASLNRDHSIQKLEEQLHENGQILSFKGKLHSLEEYPLPHPPCPPISCDSFDIRQIPTLQQKFMHITREINNYQQIFPQRQQLVTLRAKNCSSCNKVLVKPNINPLVVEYKRKHSGLLFLPRLKLLSIPKLEEGSTGPILIKIFNPLRSYLYFRIAEGNSPNSNVKLTLPSVDAEKFEFLPPCDFDPDVDDKDLFDKHTLEDSKELILKRKANYAIFRLVITPSCSFPLSSFLSFSLNIKFTLPTGEQITNFPIEFKLN